MKYTITKKDLLLNEQEQLINSLAERIKHTERIRRLLYDQVQTIRGSIDYMQSMSVNIEIQ
jgi:hypothetical protein